MGDILVNIDVDDLARAEAFYTNAFGLRPGRRFGKDGVELIGFAAPIYLLVKPGGTAATKSSPSASRLSRHWTPVHLDFVVEDVEAGVARAPAAGATVEAPVRSSRLGRAGGDGRSVRPRLLSDRVRSRGYDEIAT